MRSIGVAIAHPDPRIVDEIAHTVEAASDLFLALEEARAGVVLAGPDELGRYAAEPPGAGVAVVGLSADGDLPRVARAALSCGAQGLVCWPGDRPALRAVLREAASRARLRAGEATGMIVAVVGARGGAGTTTAAAMLACELPGSLVIDADSVGSGQASFVPAGVEPTLSQVLGAVDDLDPDTLRGAFAAHASGRALVGRARETAPTARRTGRLLELARATVPIAVCDVGRGGDEGTRIILESADAVVCVCGPDLSSLLGARALAAELGRPIRFVLNGARSRRLRPRDFERVLGSRPSVIVPVDEHVRRAGEAGRLPARGPARRALARLARDLAPEAPRGR